MSQPSGPGERRRSRRLPFPIPCVVQREGRAAPEKGIIRNVSFHGALVRLDARAEPGTRLLLSFTVGARHLEQVAAAVVWARDVEAGCDCGVGFAQEWTGRLQEALIDPRQRSVLIVEDDPEVGASLRRSLAGAGYLVDSAPDLARGLRMFEERAFDLAVVDLGLPDGSGMDFVAKVRAHPKRFAMPVVILTADARQESKLGGSP